MARGMMLNDIAHDIMLEARWGQAADALHNWLTRQNL